MEYLHVWASEASATGFQQYRLYSFSQRQQRETGSVGRRHLQLISVLVCYRFSDQDRQKDALVAWSVLVSKSGGRIRVACDIVQYVDAVGSSYVTPQLRSDINQSVSGMTSVMTQFQTNAICPGTREELQFLA